MPSSSLDVGDGAGGLARTRACRQRRDGRRDELYALIDAWVVQHDEGRGATLAAAEVPASRIYSVADMFADPQFLAARCTR